MNMLHCIALSYVMILHCVSSLSYTHWTKFTSVRIDASVIIVHLYIISENRDMHARCA